MDNVPNVILTDANSSRENKSNRNIEQNKVAGSNDLIVNKTAHGTHLTLKNIHKHQHDFLFSAVQWDAAKGYNRNEVVRVMPGVTYQDNTGATITASIGVWQCVFMVPDQNTSDAIIAMYAPDTGSYVQYIRTGSINYAPTSPEPTNTASLENPNGRYWELIGSLSGSGGGSGATRCKVYGVYDDFYICRTWDGSTTGSIDFVVAKPFEIRHSTIHELIEGNQMTYSYASRANNNDGQRTATVGGSVISQLEIVQPVYHLSGSYGDSINSEIYADQPIGGTGITNNGTAVTWLDTNRASRKYNMIG